MLTDGADAFSLIEWLIAEEGIDCFWKKTGRFVGAWTPAHLATQAKKVAMLNDAARSEATMIPRERQREEMASGTITAAWLWKVPINCIRRCPTKACSVPGEPEGFRYARGPGWRGSATVMADGAADRNVGLERHGGIPPAPDEFDVWLGMATFEAVPVALSMQMRGAARC